MGRRKEAAIRTEQEGGKTDDHRDMLYYLIDQRDSDKLKDDVFVDNLITLLFGGFDTTSIALAYCLFLLWLHPEHKEKCVAEAREVLGCARRETRANGRRPGSTYDLVNKLEYNRAVFKEALRLYPPAPLTVRSTVKDSVIGGVDVPEGTVLYIPIWWIHRSPLNWRKPDEFHPERFLRQPGEMGGPSGQASMAGAKSEVKGMDGATYDNDLLGEALR